MADWVVILCSTVDDHLVDVLALRSRDQVLAEGKAKSKLIARRVTSPQRSRWTHWLLVPAEFGPVPNRAVAWGTAERAMYSTRWARKGGIDHGLRGLPSISCNSDGSARNVRPIRTKGISGSGGPDW